MLRIRWQKNILIISWGDFMQLRLIRLETMKMLCPKKAECTKAEVKPACPKAEVKAECPPAKKCCSECPQKLETNKVVK